MKKVSTGLELTAALKVAGDMTEADYTEILRTVIFRALEEVLERTPVDTGFLLTNWHIVVDRRPSDATVSPSASSSVSKPVLPTSLKGAKFVVLYNNAEYAVSIEYGTANQAAQPMVEPTYEIIKDLAAALSSKLSRRKYDV